MKYFCMCQDSSGTPHNKEITKEEWEQDGMCSKCVEHSYYEMFTNKGPEYKWYHDEQIQNNSKML